MPEFLPDIAAHVKMGRISPSPSRAFTPHYSHSLNSIPPITPSKRRTFTLNSSRSLKNLKILIIIPPDSHAFNPHSPQNPTTSAFSQFPHKTPPGRGVSRGSTLPALINHPTGQSHSTPNHHTILPACPCRRSPRYYCGTEVFSGGLPLPNAVSNGDHLVSFPPTVPSQNSSS